VGDCQESVDSSLKGPRHAHLPGGQSWKLSKDGGGNKELSPIVSHKKLPQRSEGTDGRGRRFKAPVRLAEYPNAVTPWQSLTWPS